VIKKTILLKQQILRTKHNNNEIITTASLFTQRIRKELAKTNPHLRYYPTASVKTKQYLIYLSIEEIS